MKYVLNNSSEQLIRPNPSLISMGPLIPNMHLLIHPHTSTHDRKKAGLISQCNILEMTQVTRQIGQYSDLKYL